MKIPDEKIKGNLRFWNLVALIIERDKLLDDKKTKEKKGEEMKPYKFMALHTKLGKKDSGEEFEKYLYLTSAEADLAMKNGPEFLLQQITKGQLPQGYYDKIQLLAWKEKKRWKSKIKKKIKRNKHYLKPTA